MILSTKIIKRSTPIGANGARILSIKYAEKPNGELKTLPTGEKGVEVTFRLLANDEDMSYIFWLKKDMEYKIVSLNKAVTGISTYSIRVRELLNKRVFIVIQQEVYYKEGKQVSDVLGNPIVTLRMIPKFFPWDPEKRPNINEKSLTIIKYLDGEDKTVYEQNTDEEASSI